MKKLRKLLTAVTALGFSTITAVIVVAWCSYPEKDRRTDISNNITSSIKLGQLSDNTVGAFKTALQANLITMQDLNIINIISTCDYNLYKTETTDAIEDSDIIADTSIAIDINAKGDNFTGQANNIIVSYTKKTNINTIINHKCLSKIYVGQSNKPNKTQILKAIKDKNINASRLTTNDFNIKDSIGTTQTIIKGNGNYIGEATLEYKIINFKNISIKNIPINSTIESIIKKNNLIYVSSSTGIVYKSNGTDSFKKMTGTSEKIKSLAVDSTDNVIYAGNNKGIVYYSNGTDPFKQMTKTTAGLGEILSLAVDSTNHIIYAGSDNGIVYQSNGTDPFTKMSGTTSGAIWSLAVDSTNNIYAGTNNNGVYKCLTGKTHFTEMSGTPRAIWSLAVDSTNNIYAGTNNNGVYKSNGTDPFIKMSGTIEPIRSLAVDNNNIIYAGSDNGNVYQSNGTDPFTKMSGTSGKIKSLAVDSTNNNIYAGGKSNYNPSIFISEK